MNRRYVMEHDVINRYVRGELEPEQEQEFEEFYLTDDWAQQSLTEVIGLKRALASALPANTSTADVIELPIAHRAATAPSRPAVLNRLAIAASLFAVAAMSGGTGYWAAQGVVGAESGLSPLQRIELIETRGAGGAPEFTMQPHQPIALEVETGYTGTAPLTVNLSAAGSVVASTGGMMLDEYGRISTLLPAVTPGPYRLELLEEENGTVVAAFDFTIQ